MRQRYSGGLEIVWKLRFPYKLPFLKKAGKKQQENRFPQGYPGPTPGLGVRTSVRASSFNNYLNQKVIAEIEREKEVSMAAKKTGKNLQKKQIPQKTQTSQKTQAKPKSFFKSPLLPVIVIAVVFGVALLQMAGIIHLPHIGGSVINEIQPPAKVGVASAYDFEELISVLNPDYNGDRSAYTFYLGSGFGFPPMGMILGTDGILKGTPTGKDGKFQVCVKDVGGNSICRNYHLSVNPADSTNPDDDVQPGGCVIDARCGQPSNPNQPASINNPTITGVFVIKSCECPAGTYMYTDLGETKYCACR